MAGWWFLRKHPCWRLRLLRADTAAVDRMKLSILLLSGLMRAAGLDAFECGDGFDRVARLRPAPSDADSARIDTLADNVRVLLSIPNLADSALLTPNGPVAHAAPWLAAFGTLGSARGARQGF